ncbi:MAG: glycosyltransferase family 39 protein [Acidobacteria bacterium]|nr:glycosyltransferase family 39 protein [Acidobacteriota bacterium]
MGETPNPTTDHSPPSWAAAAIALLTIPAFLLGLSVPFFGPDEPRYAEVGREMWQSGDWITPTLGGYHWFEKPPLLYWLEAVSYSIFGVSEFSARLGPALFGLATIACLWILGRITLGSDDKSLTRWILIGAGSTLGLITFSHAATTDVIVTQPMTMALTGFFVFDTRERGREAGARLYAPLAAMYLAAGVAMLAKGLIGIIFPPAIILFYYVLSRRMPSQRLLISVVWGLPLTLAVAAIWYVPMYLRHGNEFVQEFIIRQHFERFTTNIFQHPQPFYFFLWVLPLMTLPWLPFFVFGLWKSVRRIVDRTEYQVPRLLAFSFAWLIVPVVFFSTSSSKLPSYILPAVPAAIIMAAVGIYRLAQRRGLWKWIAISIAGVTLVTAYVALVAVLPSRAAQESTKPLFDAADQRGLGSARVFLLHSYNYNAEFYAAGRLQRTDDGKQVRLFGSDEVREAIKRSGGGTTLVLVPNDRVDQLLTDTTLTCELLAQNREETMLAVSLK